jgi:molybdopterin biosynthesis enzyme
MGSADLVALSRANALVVVPETEGDLAPGARLRVLPLDDAALR